MAVEDVGRIHGQGGTEPIRASPSGSGHRKDRIDQPLSVSRSPDYVVDYGEESEVLSAFKKPDSQEVQLLKLQKTGGQSKIRDVLPELYTLNRLDGQKTAEDSLILYNFESHETLASNAEEQ